MQIYANLCKSMLIYANLIEWEIDFFEFGSGRLIACRVCDTLTSREFAVELTGRNRTLSPGQKEKLEWQRRSRCHRYFKSAELAMRINNPAGI